MKTISRRARNKTVTLYNFVSSAAGVATYQRTVLSLIYLDTGYAQRLSARGVATQDKAQLIIDLRDFTATNARAFVSLREWVELENKADYFTISTQNDFFVEGEAVDELPTVTKQQMQVKYQCYGVSSVSVPDENILQILGR